MAVDARAAPPAEARRTAAASHLSAAVGLVVPFGTVLGPFVAWLAFRDRHPYVDGQARHAVDVNLAFLAVELLLVAAGLAAVRVGAVGLASSVAGLFVVLGLAHAGVVGYLAWKVHGGQDVRIPFRIPAMGR